MKIEIHLGEMGIYRVINAGLLFAILLFGGGSFLGIGQAGALYMAVGLAAVIFFAFVNYVSVRGRVLCLAGCLGGLVCVCAVAGIPNCAAFFRSYIYWLTGSMPWQETWEAGYEVLQTFLLAFACYLLEAAMEKEFRLKIIGTLLLLGMWLYFLFTGKNFSSQAMTFFVCYVAVFYTEWTQRRWRKERRGSIQAYMVRITPFLAVFAVFLALMPAPEAPYGWQFVKSAYRQIRESFITLTQNIIHGGEEGYDMPFSGFSRESGLEGGFRENNREIMAIRAKGGIRTNVYLVGKVYDTFDGRRWMQMSGADSCERLIDTAETLYAGKRYEKQFLSDYLHPAELTVTYRYFNSAFLFAPLKTWELKEEGERLAFVQEGGSLVFDKKRGYGTEYQVYFYQMNGGREEFDSFLEAQQKDEGEILGDLLKNLADRTGVAVAPEDLENHRQRIYRDYLGDVILSSQTKEYLEEVLEGASTDVEKLRAIEAELSTFAYTRTPGELPETVTDGSGFLDYFLLESRQGYCNYFATAFVLLARAQGIPARYVQGFCVPSLGKEETIVYAHMAHAWPEVYLAGVGWIPFEPTPGYGALRYTPWKVRKEASAAGESNLSLQREEETFQEGTLEMEAEKEAFGSAQKTVGVRRMIETAGRTAAAVLGAVLLVLLLGRWLGRYRYRKLPEEEKFRAEIKVNLRILGGLGIEREEEETLEEFGIRAKESLCGGELAFLEAYEEFLYGDRRVAAQDTAAVREQRQWLLQTLKEKRKWMYICYRLKSLF